MLTLIVNGEPAEQQDLLHLALVNYGAFTSMQAEQAPDGGWGARGLDLHLARLAAWGVELFGAAPAEAILRGWIKRAVDGQNVACSIRINLFSLGLSVRDPSTDETPDVMVMAGPPATTLAGPLALTIQRHERMAPHLKHVATYEVIAARRAAMRTGYDDVLFADETGRISEGSIWNIGFLQGDTVVWPDAPMLAGTGQALIQRGLDAVSVATERRRIDVSELSTFDAAFITNSAAPATAVSAIGGVRYPDRSDLMQMLTGAWRSNPCQPI